jgi:hypothetical protein
MALVLLGVCTTSVCVVALILLKISAAQHVPLIRLTVIDPESRDKRIIRGYGGAFGYVSRNVIHFS